MFRSRDRARRPRGLPQVRLLPARAGGDIPPPDRTVQQPRRWWSQNQGSTDQRNRNSRPDVLLRRFARGLAQLSTLDALDRTSRRCKGLSAEVLVPASSGTDSWHKLRSASNAARWRCGYEDDALRRTTVDALVEAGQPPTASDEVAVPFAVNKLAEARRHGWILRLRLRQRLRRRGRAPGQPSPSRRDP